MVLQQIPEIISSIRKKGIFWPSFGGFSPWFVDPIALCLWHGNTSWQEHMAEEAAHLIETRKQRKKETRMPQFPWRTCHQWLNSPLALTSLKFLSPSTNAKLRTKHVAHGTLEDISDPHYSTCFRKKWKGDRRVAEGQKELVAYEDLLISSKYSSRLKHHTLDYPVLSPSISNVFYLGKEEI